MSLSLLAATAAAAVSGAVASSAPSATQPTLARAVVVAKTYVTERFRISGFYSVRAKRSKRNPRYALVTGYYRRPQRQPNLWVVYLRVREGRWRIHYAGVGARAIEPKIRVPCDIWPPFSEPACMPG